MIILGSAEAAFIDVTVFVGVVLLFFGYRLQTAGCLYRDCREGENTAVHRRPVRYLPGCGGSILLMPSTLKAVSVSAQ